MYYTKLYYKNYTQTDSGLEEYRLYLLKRRDNKFFQFLFGGIKINLIEKIKLREKSSKFSFQDSIEITNFTVKINICG